MVFLAPIARSFKFPDHPTSEVFQNFIEAIPKYVSMKAVRGDPALSGGSMSIRKDSQPQIPSKEIS